MNGLPLTLVLSRYDLLDILREGVGNENIMMGTTVESYEHTKDGKVIAKLTDGTRRRRGRDDRMCDGIRSKVRTQMRGGKETKLAYAGYAVYTAVCDYSQPLRESRNIPIRPRLGTSVSRPKAIFRFLRRRRRETTILRLLRSARR